MLWIPDGCYGCETSRTTENRLAAAYLTNLISNWLKKFAGQKCKHSPKTWKWQGKEQPELVASLGIVFNSKIILNSPRHKVLPGQSREQWPCPYTGDILWQSESEKYPGAQWPNFTNSQCNATQLYLAYIMHWAEKAGMEWWVCLQAQ